MQELLYILKMLVAIFLLLGIYGIVSLLIVPIDYNFAEPFIDIGVVLFMPVVLLLPQVSIWIMEVISNMEVSFGNGNGFFTVAFSLLVVMIYLAIATSIYGSLDKKDKRKYESDFV